MSKFVYLIKPMLPWLPVGIYRVEYENSKCYVIHGLFHNKDRFRELYPLELELL